MKPAKISFEDSIAETVVETGKCVGCGACVLVCPFNCLEYSDGKPSLVKKCKVCGMCAQACPQHGFPLHDVENMMFGRKRGTDEAFGVYRKLMLARATDNKILEVCQDGGAVTALLVFALKNKLIEVLLLRKVVMKSYFSHIQHLPQPLRRYCNLLEQNISTPLISLHWQVQLNRRGV